MKKTSKVVAAFIITVLIASCNNNTEKKEVPVEVKTDTVKKEEPIAVKDDAIEIYKFKGAEAYINNEYIKTCSEQEKALLAYYCYFFNTSCADSKHCKLTEALGLGEQNSKDHQKLVLKWFTDDETKQLVKDGGRVAADGAKNSSWYEEIKMTKKGTLITINYLSKWSTPKMEGNGKGTDDYEFESARIKVIGRLHEDI